MNAIIKLFGANALLTALLELLIDQYASKGADAAARAATLPQSAIDKVCDARGVESPQARSDVRDAFRAVGVAVGNVVATIAKGSA